MLALHRHRLGRWVVCALLAWAAADLVVPNLCASESAMTSHSQDQRSSDDDCFCCCTHIDTPSHGPVIVVSQARQVPDADPAPQLAAGAPPGVYRPPLFT